MSAFQDKKKNDINNTTMIKFAIWDEILASIHYEGSMDHYTD